MPRWPRVRSLEQAAAFVERVGVAVVYANSDLMLPSLWEAIAGTARTEWAVRDEKGKYVAFTPEFDRLWRWKDELPERRLACAGRHLGRSGHAGLISPKLLGSLYALSGRPGRPEDFRDTEGLTALELEVAEAVLESGPSTGPEIRRLLGPVDKKRVDRAIAVLQRGLVLTNAGVEEQAHGWPAIKVDVLARRWRASLRRLPQPATAGQRLAEAALRGAGELTAADLGAIFGWRKDEASEALETLSDARRATVRQDDGIPVWRPRQAAAPRYRRE